MNLQAINRDTVSGEALFILKNLRENGRLGRSNKLADVKSALEPAVSLEFDTYFFFLRKFHYIAMDREAQLMLTETGERVVEGAQLEKFAGEVGDFFSDQLLPPEEQTQASGVHLSDLLADLHGEPNPDADKNANPLKPPPLPALDSEDLGDFLSSSEHALPTPPQPPSRPRSSRERAGNAEESPGAGSAVTPAPGGASAQSSYTLRVDMMEVKRETPGALAVRGQDLDLRYVKYDQVGQGPLGTVHKGKHNALGLEVAIKELKDIFGYFSFLQRSEVIKRLKRELCAQAQVRHPGVVQILDQNTDVARPYFVMELLRGSLREKLDAGAGKGIPVHFAIRTFLQLSYALRAAHQQGLFHHNIKPENVLFDQYGNARLGDFGLARVIEVDASKGMPQVFVGTGGMSYLAPELIGKSTKDAGSGADVYGLGILLYEMLTGNIPGRRSALPSEVNSEAPSKLDPIFDKMTQDRRETRYPDFDGMLEDFYGAFSDGEFLVRGDLVLSSELLKPPEAAKPLETPAAV